MARLAYAHNLARVLSASPEVVELALDLEPARWPWLALPARHPVLLQKLLYFASLTALSASGNASDDAYSAMTGVSWTHALGPDSPIPTRARCTFMPTEHGDGFELVLGDGVATFRGTGVALDFDVPAWRAVTRAEVLAKAEAAPAIADGRFVVVDEANADGTFVAQGLVTTEGGFHPGHPFHTGSGDHVNVSHLVDCVAQVAEAQLGADPLSCTGGRGVFRRFVELDVPFVLKGHITGQRIDASITQVGEANGKVSLTFA